MPETLYDVVHNCFYRCRAACDVAQRYRIGGVTGEGSLVYIHPDAYDTLRDHAAADGTFGERPAYFSVIVVYVVGPFYGESAGMAA